MTAPSDERIALAWHDATCPEGPGCRSRAIHARAEAIVAPQVILRRFVNALYPPDDIAAETSVEDLRLAEHRLHLMMNIAQADRQAKATQALRGLATLLWAARHGKLVDDDTASYQVSADEYAATILGRRDGVPVRCMDFGDPT